MANEVCYATLQFDEPWSMESYLKVGGFEALKKILNEGMSPEDVIEEVKASGLRGRLKRAEHIQQRLALYQHAGQQHHVCGE